MPVGNAFAKPYLGWSSWSQQTLHGIGWLTATVVEARTPATAFEGSRLKSNYRHPAGQGYVNSVVEQLAGWGVDFVKLDGISLTQHSFA